MPISFSIQTTFSVSSETAYHAWLNSESHAAMTGGEAKCSATVGDSFTAWDGYIFGTNRRLKPPKKIVQSWRTTEFPDDAPDSDLELLFENHPDGCELTLTHTNIPDGQPDYEQGWWDHYFTPMKAYFSQ